MGFGVDTVSYLNTIDWGAPGQTTGFYHWKLAYPEFAGRYFGGGYTWSDSEFTTAKSDTGGTLNKIVPLRAEDNGTVEKDRRQTGDGTGHTYGAEDGTDTCDRIVNAINAGQLSVPASGKAYVYLDVEKDTTLTSAYWSGWANAVRTHVFNTGTPFFPAIYCEFDTINSEGKYLAQSYVRDALNAASTDYPNDENLCFGFWANEPQPCNYCPADTVPDWTVFGTYNQLYRGVETLVPVLLHQYAIFGDQATQTGGCVYFCGDSGFAGGQNLDMDGSDGTRAETYMLSIP